MVQIEIIAATHFLNEGERGRRGGAAQNDKVWGVARIQGTLVRFWGRRNGQLTFKTEVNGMPHEMLREKLIKGYELMGDNYRAMFAPTLASAMPSMYFSAMARRRLNTNH